MNRSRRNPERHVSPYLTDDALVLVVDEYPLHVYRLPYTQLAELAEDHPRAVDMLRRGWVQLANRRTVSRWQVQGFGKLSDLSDLLRAARAQLPHAEVVAWWADKQDAPHVTATAAQRDLRTCRHARRDAEDEALEQELHDQLGAA